MWQRRNQNFDNGQWIDCTKEDAENFGPGGKYGGWEVRELPSKARNEDLLCRLMNARSIAFDRLPRTDVQTIHDAIDALKQSELVRIDGEEYATHPVVAAELLRLHLSLKQVDPSAPIDMVLHCQNCGLQHIDAPEPDMGPSYDGSGDAPLWPNPPHRSHLCHGCGHIWRPADVPTNGVQAVKTKGKADSPLAAPAVKPGQATEVEKLMDAAGLCRRCAAPIQPTTNETAVIQRLLDLARHVDHALDDAEEVEFDGYRSHNIAGQDFDDVVDALDALEDLPDDKPGMTLGPAGKAEWALRRLLPNTGDQR